MSVRRPPVVIMAHGFAAEKTFRLPLVAERFARAGLAVLLFDYRGFGASDGHPRQWVSPHRQLQDWRAAIEYAWSSPELNRDRIALWGTSLAGGHVIVTAARDSRVSAIVSQVPFIDPVSTARRFATAWRRRAAFAVLRDLLHALMLRAPYCVAVAGGPGQLACIATPDALPGYLALKPVESAWQNQCPARSLLSMMFYRPLQEAERVTCPALLVAADQDSLICPKLVARTAERMSQAQLLRVAAGHFDVYRGATFDRLVGAQLDFLKQQLGPSSRASSRTIATGAPHEALDGAACGRGAEGIDANRRKSRTRTGQLRHVIQR